MQKSPPHRSSISNMDANNATTLLYILCIFVSGIPGIKLFTWILPVIVYGLEKESDFVKWHAAQATALYIIKSILSLAVSIFSFTSTVSLLANHGGILDRLFNVLGNFGTMTLYRLSFGIPILIFAIIAAIKSYEYEYYTIPLLGGIVRFVKRILESITSPNK